VGDAWRDCGDALAPGRVSACERGKRRRRGHRERPRRSTGVAGSDATNWRSSMMAGWRALWRGSSGAAAGSGAASAVGRKCDGASAAAGSAGHAAGELCSLCAVREREWKTEQGAESTWSTRFDWSRIQNFQTKVEKF